ncbi:hypothetical protein DEO72_LG8g2780 [Vigna unguiculata]|uniref:Uncharacterized protein n=1 Tax=Vigna unguiculata TaxID=3917 RepID=A0A4D6MVU5_VIGUN|nr:hypothetical protein DEO72_LG8g2780 [Vigna unguiculata]
MKLNLVGVGSNGLGDSNARTVDTAAGSTPEQSRNVVWSVLVVERMKRYGWEIGRLGKNGVSGVGTVKKVSEVRWEWNSELSAMSEENLKL